MATGIVLLAVGLACWQMKLVAYASWLALLPLACLCARLSGTARVATGLVRAAAVVLLSQATLEAAFSLAAAAVPSTPRQGSVQLAAADPRGPFQSASLSALAALRPGLVAADLDLGPYVVALTPHRVVAAPYHRLAKGRLANHAILDAELDGAETAMRGLGVDYIAVRNLTGTLPGGTARSSLRAALLGNGALGFLEPVEGTSKAPIRVWRRSPP